VDGGTGGSAPPPIRDNEEGKKLMTFAWSKTVEEKARAFCKDLTGSEDGWEDHVSAAVNADMADTQATPKSEGGYYQLVESTGEPYRAGTEHGEWQWWRPIETAPKDGTFLLLSGGKPEYLDWRDQDRQPPMVVAYYGGNTHAEWIISHPSMAFVSYDNPSHWMPLPEPPDDDEHL
jgi:hypothetical protein